MAGVGRARWSTRPVVEDCLAFDIANLVCSGVFRANPGALCSTEWKNFDGKVTFCAYFWVELPPVERRFYKCLMVFPASFHSCAMRGPKRSKLS
jgi:hypothetical protein